MEDHFLVITNFILAATIFATQGIRFACNWDILNWTNNTDHSPVSISWDLGRYFDRMEHAIWCICVMWWFDLKEYPRLKKWVNAMSVISLIACIGMILFNCIYHLLNP